MTLDDIAAFLLEFPEVTEEQPFGPSVDVYKVDGKIFAIVAPDESPASIALKCEPSLAIELREEFEAVIPGYHLNKTHWNTVFLDASIPDDEIKNMIRHSYVRVVKGLAKVARLRLSSTADWDSWSPRWT